MLLPALRYAALRYGQRHMPEFLHYSPHTGISYYTDHDELTGKTYLHSQQDVTALVERNKKLANEGVTDHGIKRDLWLWASLPSTVIVDLMRRGMNLYSGDEDVHRRIRQIVNSEYPYLKTTWKKHV